MRGYYQTKKSTSPPTEDMRASRSVKRPFGVDKRNKKLFQKQGHALLKTYGLNK